MYQRGFTLVDLLLAIGLLGLLAPVLALSVHNISRQTVSNTTRITALRPLENTGRWMREDIPLAQSTGLAAGIPGSTLTLEWTDWSDDSQYDTYGASQATYQRNRVTYSLSVTDLQRTLAVCSDWDLQGNMCNTSFVTTSILTVARNLEIIQFSRSGDLITIDVTSAPRGATWPSEQRTYEVHGTLLSGGSPMQ